MEQERRRLALVTGGAARVGRAIVEALAADGFDVGIHYRSQQDAAHALREQLANRHPDQHFSLVQQDLANPDAAAAVFAGVADSDRRVSLLVNCASLFEPETLAKWSQEVFLRHQLANVAAPLALAQEFTRRWHQGAPDPASDPQIINLLDWRATRPIPGHLSYGCSKAALWAATRILAAELAPHIRVNGMAPGLVLPPDSIPPGFASRVQSSIPLEKTGSPDDVVAALRMLLQARFATGSVIEVTGGEHL